MKTKSSASDFGRDHGLIHEAVVTSRKAGWTADVWAKLAHSVETMRDVRKVLLGHAEIATPDVIDCDADPFIPYDGWSVEEHQKGGKFKWNTETQKDTFYFSKSQVDYTYIGGKELRKELADKNVPVLNANVLDYLLANPHLIPEEWKGKAVFFWGTVYRDLRDNLCVRCLHWNGDKWDSSARWLDDGWFDDHPAAVRVH